MKALVVCAIPALLFAAPTRAEEGFRCGKWVVSRDLTVTELLSKCGSPDSKQSRTEDVRARNRYTDLMDKTGETVIETWTWNRGTQAAPMVVTIVDGTIQSIERGK